MSKKFIHTFIKGYTTPDGAVVPDTIGCIPIISWKFLDGGIETLTPSDHPRGIRSFFKFALGNRFYIVENHGQCWEPNGDIIWRNEDGAAGDEKAAA